MNAEIVREVQKLSSLATEKGLRVSAAESCTGGLIGSAITDFPGASAFFLGSAVTYSNESKERDPLRIRCRQSSDRRLHGRRFPETVRF